MEEQGTYLVSWWIYLFFLFPTYSIVFSDCWFLPYSIWRVNWFLFSLLNSIRTKEEDKQLVVLEKFPNSQENFKLPFLLCVCVWYVVRILVQGNIPPSAQIEMRVLCMVRIMAHSWSLGSGWGQHQLIQMCGQGALCLSWGEGGGPLWSKSFLTWLIIVAWRTTSSPNPSKITVKEKHPM